MNSRFWLDNLKIKEYVLYYLVTKFQLTFTNSDKEKKEGFRSKVYQYENLIRLYENKLKDKFFYGNNSLNSLPKYYSKLKLVFFGENNPFN